MKLIDGVMRWRMKEPCDNCPFSDSEAGKRLRASLRPTRMAEIEANLRNDGTFFCHKTVEEDGDGSQLVCAGALAWQDERNLDSQYRRVCERLDGARR